MRCIICGKEMGETEFGKQYCYDCEKKWLNVDNETIDFSHCFNNYNNFIHKENEEND